ncbi:MAG: DUF262 domain-containing protein [Sarcina sp.]
MKANEKSILRFLESSDTSYLIPIYQRTYSWGIEEARNLFDDLLIISKTNKKHFFGSLVTLYNHIAREKEYIIIDGQQRIITISILIIAITKYMEDIKGDAANLMNKYIVNKSHVYEERLKLKLKTLDDIEYKKIYDFEVEEIAYGSSMINNYKYFLERIQMGQISIEKLLDSISKLYIIDIELILGEDNPQLIFESLNSTGKNLTTTDKIRNYIFMGLNKNKQIEYYNKYWSVIEANTGIFIEDFITKYLYIKNINLMDNDLYKRFKLYVSDLDIKEILREIKDYSYGYKIFEKCNNLEFCEYLKYFNALDLEGINSFLIELFKEYHKKSLSDDYICEILNILENFMFRRLICGLSNKNISRFLLDSLNMAKEKSRYDLLDVFKSILLAKKDNLRYPNFIEFKKNFLQSDLYRLGSKKIIYILNKIENYDNKEIIDFKELIESKKLSVEHIMPQRLNKMWKIALGKEYKRIHQEYIHTIGNLTLTGYNSNMGNKTFQEKCYMSKGFKQSRLLINKYIAKQQEWNEKQIIERGLFLFNIIIKIFPDLKSKIKLQTEGIKMKSLDEYYNYSNSKIKGFIFEGITYNSKSYREMFNIVVSLLYDMDNLVFIKLVSNVTNKDDDIELFDLYNILSNLNTTNEILEYLYIVNISNNKRILLLKKIFELLNLSCENLVLYVS